MQKKRNFLASKLRHVKSFNGDKMLLYRRGVIVVDHIFSSHNVCMVPERLKCHVCHSDVLPQSKKKKKCQ